MKDEQSKNLLSEKTATKEGRVLYYGRLEIRENHLFVGDVT